MASDLVLLYYSLLIKEVLFLLPEMDFLEQGENSWSSSAVDTSSERTCAVRGVKAARWTRQEAVEEAEPPGLGEGEAKGGYGARVSGKSRAELDLRPLHHKDLNPASSCGLCLPK